MENQKKIEIGAIILSDDRYMYKVYGESKLYWLGNPLRVVDEFIVDESVIYISDFKKSEYIKFDTEVTKEKAKVLKSRVSQHSIIDINDIQQCYFCNGANKYVLDDRDKFIKANEIVHKYILPCISGYILNQCEKRNKTDIQLRKRIIKQLSKIDRNLVVDCLKQFSKEDYIRYYNYYVKLIREGMGFSSFMELI